MTIYTKKNNVLNNITQQKKKKCPRPGSPWHGQGVVEKELFKNAK